MVSCWRMFRNCFSRTMPDSTQVQPVSALRADTRRRLRFAAAHASYFFISDFGIQSKRLPARSISPCTQSDDTLVTSLACKGIVTSREKWRRAYIAYEAVRRSPLPNHQTPNPPPKRHSVIQVSGSTPALLSSPTRPGLGVAAGQSSHPSRRPFVRAIDAQTGDNRLPPIFLSLALLIAPV